VFSDRLEPDAVEIIEMDSMRKSIARHMRQSLDTSAHVYTVSEADMTGIMSFISEHNESFKAKHGHSLTVTHFIAAAVRDALLKFPFINASLDGSKIVKHKHLNIGIAVALGKGLVVPPVRNAEKKSLLQISHEISAIVSKAREKQLSLEDLEGSTFSITNFGVFVEIESGIDGLVHISDLSWTKRIRHPSEIVKKGQELFMHIQGDGREQLCHFRNVGVPPIVKGRIGLHAHGYGEKVFFRNIRIKEL